MSSPIERASPNDVVTLATDHGPAPMNIGAVLIIEEGSDLAFSTVRSVLEGRLPRVRRLRQRLVRMPPGCGRPIWVDDAGFDLGRHLAETVLPVLPGTLEDSGKAGHERVLKIAADLVCTPLPRHQRSGRPVG